MEDEGNIEAGSEEFVGSGDSTEKVTRDIGSVGSEGAVDTERETVEAEPVEGASEGGPSAGDSAVSSSEGSSWRDALTDETLKGNKSLAKFNDVESLAKSYLELSRKLGSKGMLPLPKNATAEQVAARRALKRGDGVNSVEDYGWKPDAALAAQLPDFNASDLGQALFEAGADADTYGAVMNAAYKAEVARRQRVAAALATNEEALRDEWNEDYDVNRKAVEMFVSKRFPDVHKVLKDNGGYRIPAVSKMFLKLNELSADGEVRIQKAAAKSFDERLKSIENSEAYKNEWHPEHKRARSAWADLIMEQASSNRR